MFRFNRIFFIFTNFFISLSLFFIIYCLRYSNVPIIGVGTRKLTFHTLILFILYSIIIIIFNISLKIYEVNKISTIKESIFSNIIISMFSIGVFGGYFYFTQTNFARFVFFLGFLMIPLIQSFFNKLLFLILIKHRHPVKLLYFGSKENYLLLNELISVYGKWFPINADYIIADKDYKILKDKIKYCNILVIDTDITIEDKYKYIINDFEISGGKIYSLIDMFSYFDQSIPAEIIHNNHYDLFSYYKLDSIYNKIFKRVFDIMVSAILLILLSPLMMITASLIKLTSKGKVFFTQKRITIGYKEFNIYKFRSMKESCSDNIGFTNQNDNRITFIGKIIRPLRIDEIPQIFNVLMGHMSLIGPRPERKEIIDQIIKKYPLFNKRILIKPGLTGWAQVKYKYVDKIDKMNKKLAYDLYYINNISFLFDMKILLYTLETVLFRSGAV